ncbi:ABC transporter ATP-binding protein [Aestuariimicrobium sp. T2.26MG-19.2B]|uniref:ABC transporter ATP-binding protein n=1 Tax=Aestuariimicrobium sp. T2.26MG-19.2B TaxID=3040679 RepID=UPI002477ACDD|nr:ABC transporter ATP-binding protein [Aestuariimicrobium sp. T2.26MG-19.2B]CAI9406609.1 Glutathione import ATP-binding protein GsiA [Aestuariimicrobium sp. T2.26MG-19.2B]
MNDDMLHAGEPAEDVASSAPRHASTTEGPESESDTSFEREDRARSEHDLGTAAAKRTSRGSKGPEPVQRGEVILDVNDLSVNFWVNGDWFAAAKGLSYQLKAGEVLAIVGESGSGKTQSSMSLLGLLPRNGRASGSAKLRGTELIDISAEKLRHIRGREIAVIFQEPMTALNPLYTVGFQIAETLRAHFVMSPAHAKERALELMRLVEIPEPERRYNNFPHQLSGGQRQRIMIAQALSCEPKLLIADEPTTALDVTVQAEILKLMRDLRERVDAGIILITHDMGVVADMADTIIVMKDGVVVEHGTSQQIFGDPQHPYTRQLLASVPHLGSINEEAIEQVDASQLSSRTLVKVGENAIPLTDGPADVTPALLMEDVAIEYPKQGRNPAFRAAHHINLRVDPGEVVGLVGESGSGKTTIGRAAVALLPAVEGKLSVAGRDITHATQKELLPFRREVGIVFQDPGSSLNPRLPVGESIGEPLLLHEKLRGQELSKRVEALLDSVQLPRAMRNRYPHELSGGQRQRIGIARSLALQPKLLIADEPTSALDVSVQATVLKLFQDLQAEYGFACLFISHDLAVVEMLSKRIAVMRHGHLVEVGPTNEIVRRPQHEYTQRLLAAVPVPDPDEQRKRRELRDQIMADQIS